MSVTQQDRTRQLQIQVNIGTTAAPKYKKQSFNYIFPNANLDKMKPLGEKIAACQTYPLDKVILVDKASLVDDGN